jgi:xanthine/uracil permease
MLNVRLRLINDWRQAHKWSSMRFLAVSAALQASLQAPAYVTQYLPQWVLQGASTASFACLFLAGLGRITKLEKNDVRDPNAPDPRS